MGANVLIFGVLLLPAIVLAGLFTSVALELICGREWLKLFVTTFAWGLFPVIGIPTLLFSKPPVGDEMWVAVIYWGIGTIYGVHQYLSEKPDKNSLD